MCPTRRFPTNQIPAFRFHARLDGNAPKVELTLVQVEVYSTLSRRCLAPSASFSTSRCMS